MWDEGLEQGEVVHFHTEQRKEAEDTGRGSLIHSGEAQRNQRGMRTQGKGALESSWNKLWIS